MLFILGFLGFTGFVVLLGKSAQLANEHAASLTTPIYGPWDTPEFGVLVLADKLANLGQSPQDPKITNPNPRTPIAHEPQESQPDHDTLPTS